MGVKITQNSLQNLARFLVRFWAALGAQNGAQMDAKSLPTRSWKQLGVGGCFRSRFGSLSGCFLTPRTLETHAPMQVGARFPENLLFRLRTEKGPQNEPKIDPKTGPRGLQMGQNGVPNRC